ncbi:glycosyltransferase family 2 protein [uncultured Marivita sp.]|uniref:glycosyltransferase family 2 protein n=1 Tax=uncultured Marivita sp. TaxID=888080 RepID=UPI002630F9B1|nr:glycosyltransferase family 2 protein [uncultured Marivita sp.]
MFHVDVGQVDQNKLTLFSVMKNEIDFLPAWLEHHRGIGFEQFLIFDDASNDGTHDYLANEPDVVVITSELGYGDEILFLDPDGSSKELRFGVYSKIAAPHLFFDGSYVAYLDADEFLLLPPGVTSISDVISRLQLTKAPAAIASVVEFFPRDTAAFSKVMPKSFPDLLLAYPWFEPDPLLELEPGKHPVLIGQSKSEQLFEKFKIYPNANRGRWDWLKLLFKAKRQPKMPSSPRRKTPVVLRDSRSRMIGSHRSNLPPSSDVMLTVAHFVFTAQFAAKIERAKEWGAHANGGRKYHYYARLLEAMKGVPDGFMSERSERYHGPDQLLACGLMRW